MPIDRKSKTELISRIVDQAKTESDASEPDSVRLEARRRKKFYNTVLNKLKNGQSTDNSQ